MRILVCIKQILDPRTIRVSSRGELDTREGVPIINPADACALEEALSIKDKHGAEIIALSLGNVVVEDVLRQALAMGADRAIRVWDDSLAASDAYVMVHVLAQAVGTIGDVDLVLAGAASADTSRYQVGPQMAEMLGLPQITGAVDLEVGGAHVSGTQVWEDCVRRVTVPLPALVTIPAQANQPRLPTCAAIINAVRNRVVEVWSAADVRADPALLGESGSLVTVRRVVPAERDPVGDTLTGSMEDAAHSLARRLHRKGFI